VNYKNPHEKSNKNYITDMFNYLGYALFIIIGNDKEYHDWCKNGRRQFLDDPIARDVYYLLKYLKDSKLPDNPYVSHLFDCRNAIAHWTDERDHFRSFNTLDMNSLERENSSLVPEEEEKNQQSKKPLLSVEEYLMHADDLLELLYEDEEIYKLCDSHKTALKQSQKNIKILITNFRMHKSYNGEIRQSLDYAYHLPHLMLEYREFALNIGDYNTVNVINELDWVVTCFLRGEDKKKKSLDKKK